MANIYSPPPSTPDPTTVSVPAAPHVAHKPSVWSIMGTVLIGLGALLIALAVFDLFNSRPAELDGSHFIVAYIFALGLSGIGVLMICFGMLFHLLISLR